MKSTEIPTAMEMVEKIDFLSRLLYENKQTILGTGINLTFIFWQPQVATWGYSHSTPSGLCELKV